MEFQHLQYIRIFNFRSIVDSGWFQLHTITRFIGMNDSGKSNILEALLYFSQDGSLDDKSVTSWKNDRELKGYGNFSVVSYAFLFPNKNPDKSHFVCYSKHLDGTYSISKLNIQNKKSSDELLPCNITCSISDLHCDLSDHFGIEKQSESLGNNEEIKKEKDSNWFGSLWVNDDVKTGFKYFKSEIVSFFQDNKEILLKKIDTRSQSKLCESSDGQFEDDNHDINGNDYEIIVEHFMPPMFSKLPDNPKIVSELKIKQSMLEETNDSDEFVCDRNKEHAYFISLLKTVGIDNINVSQETMWNVFEDPLKMLEPDQMSVNDFIARFWQKDNRFSMARSETGKVEIKISDEFNRETLLHRRSNGFRWYIAFLIAVFEILRKSTGKKHWILLDEPATFLHLERQGKWIDLLAYIEDRFKNSSGSGGIVYCTHSPTLVTNVKNPKTIKLVHRIHKNEIPRLQNCLAMPYPGGTFVWDDYESDLSASEEVSIFLESVGDHRNSAIKPVLVEGQSDINWIWFMRKVFELIYLKPSRFSQISDNLGKHGVGQVYSPELYPLNGTSNCKAVLGFIAGMRKAKKIKIILDDDKSGRNLKHKLEENLDYIVKDDPDRVVDVYLLRDVIKNDVSNTGDITIESLIHQNILKVSLRGLNFSGEWETNKNLQGEQLLLKAIYERRVVEKKDDKWEKFRNKEGKDYHRFKDELIKLKLNISQYALQHAEKILSSQYDYVCTNTDYLGDFTRNMNNWKSFIDKIYE